MTDEPVRARHDLMPPMTIRGTVRGVAALLVLGAIIAGLFCAVAWAIVFASSLVRNIVG